MCCIYGPSIDYYYTQTTFYKVYIRHTHTHIIYKCVRFSLQDKNNIIYIYMFYCSFHKIRIKITADKMTAHFALRFSLKYCS